MNSPLVSLIHIDPFYKNLFFLIMDDFETNFGTEENKTDDTLEVSSGQHGQNFSLFL